MYYHQYLCSYVTITCSTVGNTFDNYKAAAAVIVKRIWDVLMYNFNERIKVVVQLLCLSLTDFKFNFCITNHSKASSQFLSVSPDYIVVQ